MDSQERLGEATGVDTAGIYTVTVNRVEVAFPGSEPVAVAKGTQSPTFVAVVQHRPVADFGTVNIYQARGGALGHGAAGKAPFDDKSDNGSNLSGVTANDEDSDIISEYIGHYGRWQFGWTFLLCLFQIPTTFHIFCLVFQVSCGP
uniref:Uncharacterized protein n=1 Tax=Anopheles dirus TaxID=7168 RepID=A0A182NFM8_9DIPT